MSGPSAGHVRQPLPGIGARDGRVDENQEKAAVKKA
jgi:hypothetical protein